ncbi:hypothetical protein ACIQXD_19635 [Streptomyces uncialis]|uniref:hypothetical protein n=1 Tax=Streptomyces uncialis TaxID=1048205 RepID=UPI0037F2099F
MSVLARRAGADERADHREVLAPVVRALAEITVGRPGVAVGLLSGLGEGVERVGGVRVEREIVQDTLARALVDTRDHPRAAGCCTTAPPPAAITPARTFFSPRLPATVGV